MKKKFILTLLFVFILTSNVFAQEITLDIYSVNDFHGALEKQGKNPGIAELAGFLKTKINNNKDHVLLLSAGDMSTGTLDSAISKGKIVFDYMNKLGFDAMAIGNHEFDWGLDQLSARIKQAKFPVLAANIWYQNSRSPLEGVKPYVIVKKAGLKIGIIGITTPQTAYSSSPKIVKDLVFAPPSIIVQNIVNELKDEVDLIIVLSHLGSLQNEQGTISDEAADLANAVSGVDVIVSGHTHKKVMGKVNNIPVVQADWSGRAVGHVKLTYDSNSKKVVRSMVEFISLQTNSYPADPMIAEHFEKYQKSILPLKNKVLGSLTATLTHDKMSFSSLGEWVCDTMKNSTNSDFAVLTGGNLRSSLNEGIVTYGMIFNVMPFDNNICTVEMTGAQILHLLEQGIFNDSHGGFLQFAGINIIADKSNRKILEVTLSDGTNLDSKKTYKVATIDFLADGGDQLTAFTDPSNVVTILPDKLVDVLAEEFVKRKTITYQNKFKLIEVNEAVKKVA